MASASAASFGERGGALVEPREPIDRHIELGHPARFEAAIMGAGHFRHGRGEPGGDIREA